MNQFLHWLSLRSPKSHLRSLCNQNNLSLFIKGKNNVQVQPQGRDTFLPGYLSFHQITKEGQNHTTLAIKWTPNQLMNGPSSNEEKNASWQEALFINLNTILFLHCHQVWKTDSIFAFQTQTCWLSFGGLNIHLLCMTGWRWSWQINLGFQRRNSTSSDSISFWRAHVTLSAMYGIFHA